MVHDRVVTVANAITFVRLLGLPLFVWLMVGPARYGLAFGVLAVVATTDWIDGYVARRFNQITRLGRVLDPLVDRALLATVGITLAAVGILPVWVIVAILMRDALLLVAAGLLFRGIPDIPVSRTGKFATACLLAGVPSFLLAELDWCAAEAFTVVAWAFTPPGLVAYYAAGVLYALAARQRLRPASPRREPGNR